MICMHTRIGVCFEFTIYPTITKLFDMLTVEMVLSIDSKRAHSHHCANVDCAGFGWNHLLFSSMDK